MSSRRRSSRVRYFEYRQRVRERHHPSGAGPHRRGRQRSFLRLLRDFLHMVRGHRHILVLAMLAATISTLLGLIPLYGPKIVFDNVLGEVPLPVELPAWVPLPSSRMGLLGAVVSVMVVVAIVSLLFGIWGRWQTTRLTKRVQISVRRRVFEHAVRLPLHRVHELKSGGVASILREDAGGVGELVFAMLYNPWRAIIQLTGSLIILAAVDWRLLLGSLVLLPVVYVTHRTWISRIRPLHRDIRASRQQIDGHATETFGGMRVVRGFARQQSEAAEFVRDNDMMARQELHAWWWMRGVEIAWAVLIPLASAALLGYGGWRILQDRAAVEAGILSIRQALTVGDLVMFLGYLIALLSPLETLANSATGLQSNLAALDRILDLLGESREMPDRQGAVALRRDSVKGRITLRDVGFTYPGTPTPVLREINLDVQAGEVIALVGPSGAGKTTLCNLIARFYDPTEGTIALDGIDLRDTQLSTYRSLLGIVEQDTFLFAGTVGENIAYGRRDATDEQVRHAARLANADEFISRLPSDYETIIGERGVKLSGGQRQRLAIARAILADPRILILDEATSNLDTESERLIQRSLSTLMRGRTCFIIAHRLSTVTGADRIIVLEGGRIVEEGGHAELLGRSGRYRTMVELQTRPISEDEGRVSPEGTHAARN